MARADFALPDGVAALIPDYLSRQRWYSGGRPDAVEVVRSEGLTPTR